MRYTPRMAAGVLALAAATIIPAQAIASTAPSRAVASRAAVTPAPAPLPPGTHVAPIVLKYNADSARVSWREYAAGQAAYIRCVDAAGLPIVATRAGVTAGGWTFGTPTTPRARYLESAAGQDAQDRVLDTCLVQVFHLDSGRGSVSRAHARHR